MISDFFPKKSSKKGPTFRYASVGLEGGDLNNSRKGPTFRYDSVGLRRGGLK